MTMETEVTLTDQRIRLRPSRPEQAEAIHEAVHESIAELSPWAPWCSPDYDMSHCRPWLDGRAEAWANGLEYDFVILDAQTGQLLGGCGLSQINRTHNFANLGYWVRTSRTGRGIATAAVRLLAQFGFERLGFTRLEIVVSAANRASRRVAEKAGATREGVLRNRLAVGDVIHDAVAFSLIPQDMT